MKRSSFGTLTTSRTRRFGQMAVALLAVVGGSLALGTGASGAATSGKKDAGVVIRYADVSGGDALYFAIKTGLLDKDLAKYGATAKIVSTFPAEAPALQALAANAADITTGSITATEGGLAGESDVQVFAYEPDGVGPVPGEAILVKANSGITSVKDLVGKTVAVNQAGTGEYLLDKVLTYYNLPESSVKKVYLQPPAGATAFESGQVDAWATFSTYIPQAEEQYGAKILVGGNQVKTQNDTVYVANTSFAKAHPELVKAVYQAIATESSDLLKNHKPYDNFLETTDHLTSAGIISYSNKTLQTWQPVGAAQEKVFQNVANYFYKEGSLPSQISLSNRVFEVDGPKG
jgi:sulfonate transport system substrate-binding protein